MRAAASGKRCRGSNRGGREGWVFLQPVSVPLADAKRQLFRPGAGGSLADRRFVPERRFRWRKGPYTIEVAFTGGASHGGGVEVFADISCRRHKDSGLLIVLREGPTQCDLSLHPVGGRFMVDRDVLTFAVRRIVDTYEHLGRALDDLISPGGEAL